MVQIGYPLPCSDVCKYITLSRGLGRFKAAFEPGCLELAFASGIVITSEARNLLLFAPGTTAGEEQHIRHGLKAVRYDNSEIVKAAVKCRTAIADFSAV